MREKPEPRLVPARTIKITDLNLTYVFYLKNISIQEYFYGFIKSNAEIGKLIVTSCNKGKNVLKLNL
jgi:rRNA maturation protein Rpf1